MIGLFLVSHPIQLLSIELNFIIKRLLRNYEKYIKQR